MIYIINRFLCAVLASGLVISVLPAFQALAQSSSNERLFAPPAFSSDLALTRAQTRLRDNGYVNQDHIDLDAYYAADKRYDGILVNIDRMVSRGETLEAFNGLGEVMSHMYPHNRKAWLDASRQRMQLASKIPGLARSEYETVVIENYMVEAEVCAIEADGYKAPRLQPRHNRELRNAEKCLRDICQRLTSVNVQCADSAALIASGTNWNRQYSFISKGIDSGGPRGGNGAVPNNRPDRRPDSYASAASDYVAVYMQPSTNEELVGTLSYGNRVSVWEYADNENRSWVYICGHEREWCGWSLQEEFFRED